MNGMPDPGEQWGMAGAAGAVLGTAVYLTLVWNVRRHERVVRRRTVLVSGCRFSEPRAEWSARRRPALGRARWWVPSLASGAAGWILVGGSAGCAAGLAVAYAVWRWQRSGRRSGAIEREAEAALVARQLPLVADLLAACVSAGAGPREAAEAVGESVGGPVGDQLARTAAEIRLGGEPAEAWARFGEIPGAAPLARCLERAGSTGAPAAEPVSGLADEMRAERASAATARAQRAGVLITAPVGLCFLPAFLAVGVAPVVIGLATGLLHHR